MNEFLKQATDENKVLFQASLILVIKELLEKKHLYQSLKLEWKTLDLPIKSRLEKYPSPVRKDILEQVMYFKIGPWVFLPQRPEHPPNSGPLIIFQLLSCELPTISIYCSNPNCHRIQPHNPLFADDCTRYVPNGPKQTLRGEDFTQVLVFSYLCQGCKNEAVVFLIHREGEKLTVAGRSRIEEVQVPSYIPKGQKKYYSGAIVAFQSGQILAGLFMLRTFIEQVSRVSSKDKNGHADTVIDEYMESLPEDFKQRFPSLRDIYREISEAIHKAAEDANLFNGSLERINQHFKAKEIFEAVSPIVGLKKF